MAYESIVERRAEGLTDLATAGGLAGSTEVNGLWRAFGEA